MRLPFMEALEREQRVALVGLIVRRLDEMGVLSDEVKDIEARELAHDVVGITNMDSIERWTAVNATIAATSKVVGVAAVVGSDIVSPALHGLADAVSRLSERRRPTPRLVRLVERPVL